ncbi:hypothetical protein C8J57DRAFT_1540819 [Mycena rebaudengoi]|nr:hypothetical protein C8J57DRAFT_1540819 [Mycena rebaudengoi]
MSSRRYSNCRRATSTVSQRPAKRHQGAPPLDSLPVNESTLEALYSDQLADLEGAPSTSGTRRSTSPLFTEDDDDSSSDITEGEPVAPGDRAETTPREEGTVAVTEMVPLGPATETQGNVALESHPSVGAVEAQTTLVGTQQTSATVIPTPSHTSVVSDNVQAAVTTNANMVASPATAAAAIVGLPSTPIAFGDAPALAAPHVVGASAIAASPLAWAPDTGELPDLLPAATIHGERLAVRDAGVLMPRIWSYYTLLRDEDMVRVGVLSRLRNEHHLDVGRLRNSAPALLRRLERLMTFVDTGRGIYGALSVPSDAVWGPNTAFGDLSKVLCKAGTTVPISVWIVGEVVSTWMYDCGGNTADRATLNLLPLRQDLVAACGNQLSSLSRPQDMTSATAWGPSQVRAYRWMNTGPRVPGVPQAPTEFVDYFDATVRLQDKSRMERLPVQNAEEHDLVLVEAKISRYARCAEGQAVERQGGGGSRRATMDRWVAYYELQAINLLERALVAVAEHVDDTNGVLDL